MNSARAEYRLQGGDVVEISVSGVPELRRRAPKERCHCEPAEFVVASRYFAGAVRLPLFAGMTDAQVDRVASVVREILG
jgi:protein involved in polysaccharide export with SLBB domain